MSTRTTRVYEEPDRDDGFRVLVDRIWPRGLSKRDAAIDLWLKDVAPTSVLRKWFGHDESNWPEFRERYFAELRGRQQALKPILARARRARVARRRCRAFAGRLDLRSGLAETLPFEDGVFDRSLSVRTTYFWPQLGPGLREIRRVLRDHGRFVLGFRPADDELAAASLPASVYTLHSIEEMTSALLLSGFGNVSVKCTELKKGFIAWAICK